MPEFGRHILPLVGKLGCSNRACHGSFQGQNGFRLSLFGSDPAADHKALTEDQNGEGSRVNVKDPDESLALYKPTHGDEHGGGERMKAGGWKYRMLREWIKAGAPFRPEKEVHVTQLTMTPAEIVLAKGQKPVRLQVLAHFSDGTMEDVTCLTTFESRDESVATISESGEISTQRPGDTAIVATFGPVVTSAQVLVPRPGEIVATSKEWSLNPVDELVREKLRKLNLRPSEVASDAVFLRRAYLDVIGTLPTPNEVREFLADSRPDKRAKLFDQLLDRPEYAKYYLGVAYESFSVQEDPNDPKFSVRALTPPKGISRERVSRRIRFLNRIDQGLRTVETKRLDMEGMDQFSDARRLGAGCFPCPTQGPPLSCQRQRERIVPGRFGQTHRRRNLASRTRGT